MCNRELRRATAVLVTLGFCLLAAGPVAGQCESTEAQRFEASDAGCEDQFGSSVSYDGKRLLVGAPVSDGSGSAYVYHRAGAFWQEFKLVASDAEVGDHFGEAVAVQGDQLVVGVPYDDDLGANSGAVVPFSFDGVRWVEGAKRTAGGGVANDWFGRCVALDRDLLVVGSPGDDDLGSFSGSVYTYRRLGTRWTFEQKLTASDGAIDDYFGYRVAADGDVIVVGAPFDDQPGPNTGSAYVFRYDGSNWVEETKLRASVRGAEDRFGLGVSVYGGIALIGAPGVADLGIQSGAAYVFRYDGVQWNEERKLTAWDGGPGQTFGRGVALRDGYAVVSALDVASLNGAAYVHRFDGVGWPVLQKLTAGANLDWEGSLAVRSGRVAVGARHEPLGESRGATDLFRLPELAFDAEPHLPQPGDALSLDTCGGFADKPALLAVVDVNGTPTFVRVAVGVFRYDGVWSLRLFVPPGLAGMSLTFRSLGFIDVTTVVTSNEETVLFQ